MVKFILPFRAFRNLAQSKLFDCFVSSRCVGYSVFRSQTKFFRSVYDNDADYGGEDVDQVMGMLVLKHI